MLPKILLPPLPSTYEFSRFILVTESLFCTDTVEFAVVVEFVILTPPFPLIVYSLLFKLPSAVPLKIVRVSSLVSTFVPLLPVMVIA
ncbi:hypothetical protein SDC9_140419 [bioreactor metagenome]|uniref:Uncharacterized protein n=1 Tax=bioreactor metagenome TaxID=1076179 RepID=A0A645DXF4_9ZZZZ